MSAEKVSDEDYCLSRSMMSKASDKIAADLLDNQYVTLHVPLTPETKNPIDKE